MSKLNETGSDITRAAFKKTVKNVISSDAWREEKEKDPSIEFRMSYAEFKKIYFSRKKNPGENKILKKRV